MNNSCIFDLQWHVIAIMHGNSGEEIAGRCRQNNSFCHRNMSPGLWLYATF